MISSYVNPVSSGLINFHSLEVVDRVSETQHQVGENSNSADIDFRRQNMKSIDSKVDSRIETVKRL